MSLRDNGPTSPIDHHHHHTQHHQYHHQGQQQQYQPQHQRRYSQYGSERAPSSPLTRKNTTGHMTTTSTGNTTPGPGYQSQRNSMGIANGSQSMNAKRQSNRMSLASVSLTGHMGHATDGTD
ncbi:hypothetical protein EC991_003906 [Linnemannia zychae]|nr:hypothetical protein EC991_003906 [Linnemannia zychae]